MGITVATEEITNLAAKGTKKLVKKRFSKLNAKFKRKAMEVMEKEKKYSD